MSSYSLRFRCSIDCLQKQRKNKTKKKIQSWIKCLTNHFEHDSVLPDAGGDGDALSSELRCVSKNRLRSLFFFFSFTCSAEDIVLLPPTSCQSQINLRTINNVSNQNLVFNPIYSTNCIQKRLAIDQHELITFFFPVRSRLDIVMNLLETDYNIQRRADCTMQKERRTKEEQTEYVHRQYDSHEQREKVILTFSHLIDRRLRFLASAMDFPWSEFPPRLTLCQSTAVAIPVYYSKTHSLKPNWIEGNGTYLLVITKLSESEAARLLAANWDTDGGREWASFQQIINSSRMRHCVTFLRQPDLSTIPFYPINSILQTINRFAIQSPIDIESRIWYAILYYTNYYYTVTSSDTKHYEYYPSLHMNKRQLNHI